MRQIKITIMVFLVPIVNLFGQNVKSFSGDFENGKPLKAKVTYAYYEDAQTKEFIKHGRFKYTDIIKKTGSIYNATFTGNFKNNFKNGVWNYTIKESNFPHTDDLYYTGITKLIANFSNGYPNGVWTYTCKMKRRQKKYNGWSAFENLPIETVTGTFKKGILTGNLKILNNPYFSDYKNVTGQYDASGNPNGKWVFKNPEKIKTIEFQKGVTKSFIIREINSGKVLNSYVESEEMQKIINDFIQGKITINELTQKKIKVDTSAMVEKEHGLLYFGLSFNDAIFMHRYIGGDKTYYYKEFDESLKSYNQKTGWFDSRNYGLVLTLKKIKQFVLKDMSDFKRAENSFNNKDFKYAKKKFKAIYDSYSKNISEADKQLLVDRIKQCDKGLLQKKQSEIIRVKYNKANQYYNAVNNWNDYFGYVDYVQKAHELYAEILTKHKESLQIQDINEITKRQNKCKDYIKKANQNRLEKERFKIVKEEVKSNSAKIKNVFAPKENDFGGVTVVTVKKKKKLYNAYVEITKNLNSKLSNARGMKAQLQITEQIVALQIKILSLVNGDSKEIEKQLKKATTVEQKIQILNL